MAQDFSGWGPQSDGYNPSPYDQRRRQRIVNSSSDVYDHINMMSPQTKQMALRMAPGNLTPAQKDAWLYDTFGGDMARTVMAPFVSNLMLSNHFGSAANTAANYAQAVARGSYVTSNIPGATGGSMLVGNGGISAHIAKQMFDRMTTSTLGKTQDPSNFYGMNREDVSQLTNYATENRRFGPIAAMNSVTAQEAMQKRLRSGDMAEDDRAKLSSVLRYAQERGFNDAQTRDYLKTMSASKDANARQKDMFSSLSTQTVSIDLVEKGAKEMEDYIKALGKTVSKLSDTFGGELSNPQILMKMRTLTGTTDAARSSEIVSKLLGTAAAHGADAREMIRTITDPNAVLAGVQSLQGAFGGGGTLDETRVNAARANLTLGLRRGAAINAVSRYQGSAEGEFNKDEFIAMATSSQAQAAQALDASSNNTLSVAMGWADADPKRKEIGDKIRAMVKEMERMDPAQRQSQIQRINELGRANGMDFNRLSGTAQGAYFAQQMKESSNQALLAGAANDLLDGAAGAAVGYSENSAVARAAGGVGAGHALAKAAYGSLGVDGLYALMNGKDVKGNLQAQLKMIDDYARDPQEAAQLKAQLFSGDKLNDAAVSDLISAGKASASTIGTLSKYGQDEAAKTALNNWGSGTGTRPKKGGWGSEILKSMLLGNDGKLAKSDNARMAALMGIGAGEELGVVNFKDYKNLSVSDLESMQSMSSKEGYDLAKSMGFSTIDELHAAAQKDDALKRAVLDNLENAGGLEFLRNDTGDGFTAVDRSKLRGDAVDKRLHNEALAAFAAGQLGVGVDEQNSVVDALKRGEGFTMDKGKTDALGGSEFTGRKNNRFTVDDKKMRERIAGFSGLNEQQMGLYRELNEKSDGAILNNWKQLRTDLNKDEVFGADGKTKLNQEEKDSLTAELDKLISALMDSHNQVINTAEFKNVTVTGEMTFKEPIPGRNA